VARWGAAYSTVVGWSANREVPARLRPLAYRAFARAVGANLDEVEQSLDAYPTFGDFFARRLRDGARTIDVTPSTIIAPCDGVIAARGVARDGALVQAKGRHYQLGDLLVDDALTPRLVGGEYVTIYLSPRDYHRVHASMDAELVGYSYVPGALWPVNPRVAARKDQLLVRNERVVIHLNSPQVGHVAVVMVGASGVGNISLVHGFGSASVRPTGERHRIELEHRHIAVARGDELGAFRLGSTVVMVFEPGRASLAGEVGQAIRFGESLGKRGGST
jgi:phosphatidylserine decarboxylase